MARVWRDRGGAAIVWVVASLPALFGASALALDYGQVFTQRQQLQAVADLAALEAARALPDTDLARARALDSLARQLDGVTYDAEVTFGAYGSRSEAGDFRYPAATRFQSGAGQANSLRVEVERRSDTLFGTLVDFGPPQVGASAVAARSAEFASLAIASSLASVDTEQSVVLNSLLGSLLGTSVNLSAVAWEGLLTTNLELLSFLERLAVEVGVSVVETDEILDASLALSDWLRLLGDSLEAGEGQGALAAAASGAAQLAGDLAVDPLLRVGDLVALEAGETTYGMAPADTLVNVFDLVRLAAELANGRHGLTAEVAVPLPGADIALRAFAVSGPQPIAVAPEGAAVATSQLRVLLDLGVGLDTSTAPALAGLVGSLLQVDLELLVDLAPARAEVAALGCNTGDRPRYVDLDVTPGLARVGLGDVEESALSLPATPAVDEATLLQLSLLGIPAVRVNALADLTVNGAGGRERFFAPFAPPQERTVGSTGLVSNLGSELIQDLDLRIQVLPGLPLLINGLLDALVNTLLSAVLPALQLLLANVLGPILDPLLDGLLTALGIQVGSADVAVGGLSCGQVRLVAS
ncbi:hypothetical protein AY600_20075 [Phormidium willei BDU 130791]|nr:hypothetical protein AY600_20075 [Phormidium willei BDU 130791]